MSLSEFSDYLNKFQEMLPNISQKISDSEFNSNLQDITQKMIELIPSTQKALEDSQNLLEAFCSLQKALVAMGMQPTFPTATSDTVAKISEVQEQAPSQQQTSESTVAGSESGQETATSETEDATTLENEQQTTTPESEQQTTTPESEQQTTTPESEQTTVPESEQQTTTPESEQTTVPESEQQITTSESTQETATGDAITEEKPNFTKVDANTLEESKDTFSNAPLDISPSREDEKPQVTISTPQKHQDTAENKHLYFSEDEVMKELQVDISGLEEMIEEKKLTPTLIEDKKYFSKKKVSLLRSVAMESSTVVIEKPVKQPLIFGSTKKETPEKESTKDYYNENEVMLELQTDRDGLESMIEQKKLIPTMIDGKRYFPKRKVTLLRSMAMELSTIVIQKPKKKNPLNFWKDN
ncbi:hypothetical protein UABAM_04403 [Candidatus Uabimicrobium amorphum]|uniref:Uncharacterized protein n=1 Tax=Uabimicrobium amorphum TaxID=2596890 RepID=A0A5S9F4P5_UABAM|nr:hypothetical protein [Candidatus Uabimicrobium amorphum]BBM86017.1 hypothetical protein UABAM_04403 [Candidatus Uabimicrobium amorphum]